MFMSMHEILAGADAAKEGVDDWNELWVNAIVTTQNMPRKEDEWAAFVKMKAATLSVCTVHALRNVCHKRGWHADASDSRETLIDKVTTKLLRRTPSRRSGLPTMRLCCFQDNFSASLESPEDQNVKASIAAALQSDAGNRGNTSRCGKYLSVEHTLHAVGILTRFLAATSMLYALHSGEAERGHVSDSKPCLKEAAAGFSSSEKHSVDVKAS